MCRGCIVQDRGRVKDHRRHMPDSVREQRIQAIVSQLDPRPYPELARALRAQVDSILHGWRGYSLRLMPYLDRLTVAEFENSIAIILNAIADAMESGQPGSVRNLIDHSPEHGFDRFLHHYDPHDLLAEERILRAVIITELEAALHRAPTAQEAAALHELIDIMIQYSVLELIRKRNDELRKTQEQLLRSERLAGLGTLAAGVGHDLNNLLLPLRIRVEALQHDALSQESRAHIEVIAIIADHLQNIAVNLRMLSVDPEKRRPVHEPADLRHWCSDTGKFYAKILPPHVTLECDIPDDLPPLPVSKSALSQSVYNLIQNSIHALSGKEEGRITLRIRTNDRHFSVFVEDNGRGMTEEVLQHCMEPFFTTKSRGMSTGLGLPLVKAIVDATGGSIDIHSPPPGQTQGTAVELIFPLHSQPQPQPDSQDLQAQGTSESDQRRATTSALFDRFPRPPSPQ